MAAGVSYFLPLEHKILRHMRSSHYALPCGYSLKAKALPDIGFCFDQPHRRLRLMPQAFAKNQCEIKDIEIAFIFNDLDQFSQTAALKASERTEKAYHQCNKSRSATTMLSRFHGPRCGIAHTNNA